MSIQQLSVPVVAGPDAEPPQLSLALTRGPVTVIGLCGDLGMSTTPA